MKTSKVYNYLTKIGNLTPITNGAQLDIDFGYPIDVNVLTRKAMDIESMANELGTELICSGEDIINESIARFSLRPVL